MNLLKKLLARFRSKQPQKAVAGIVFLFILLLTIPILLDLPAKTIPGEPLLNQSQNSSTPTAITSSKLTVHFINVGQGDSILLQTPEQNILIDAGERSTGAGVAKYIKNNGITSLDLVIGTHPHSDHIGGLIHVLDTIPVKEIIDPGVVHTTSTFEEYLTAIDQKEIKFTEGRAGMNRDLGGGVMMQILHPSAPSSSDLNNASIVARVTFGEISFIFSGDAESKAENQILGRGYNLDSTVLKIGHHGSRSSTTEDYLSAVKPELAVIMCGQDNTYGHPHEETLAKLVQAGVELYRTDIHGTVIMITDGQTVNVNKQPLPK